MVGISLKAYWEQTELAFNELHERLRTDNMDGCFHYMRYREILLRLVDAGKKIEDVGVFSLKSAGDIMAKMPAEFGEGELPDPALSHAVREFCVTYHAHLLRFVTTEFASPSRLINMNLPGQKPKIEKMANVLSLRIAAVAFEEGHFSNHDLPEDSVGLSDSSSNMGMQVSLPYFKAKSILIQSHYFSGFKAKLNEFIFGHPAILENDNVYGAVENYLTLLLAKEAGITESEIKHFHNFRVILAILGKLKEYETLIESPGSAFIWPEYLAQYEIRLASIRSGIQDQLEGCMVQAQDAITPMQKLITALIATLHSIPNHIQDLKDIAQKWLDLPRVSESKPTPASGDCMVDFADNADDLVLIKNMFENISLKEDPPVPTNPSSYLSLYWISPLLPWTWGTSAPVVEESEAASSKEKLGLRNAQ
jgi:hypothetical protein